MPPAPQPPEEAERLASLRKLQLLDTPAEERFDRLTRMAATHFRVPYSLLSLVDEDRQWFKSSQGFPAPSVSRAAAMCAYNILDEAPLIIPDATRDLRFADSPLVTGETHIRFYAGIPLHGPDGHRVGSFCILDSQERSFSSDELDWLRDVAAIAQDELALIKLSRAELELMAEMDNLRRKASLDGLTRAWNREAILDLLSKEMQRAERSREPLCVTLLDVDFFKSVNDDFGHQAGDAVLRGVADRVRACIRPYDSFGRYGGEEFLTVIPNCELPAAQAQASRVLESFRARPFEPHRIRTTGSIGAAVWDFQESREALIERADQALYRAKHQGRDQVVVYTSRDPS